jgi:hypothetical protein
MPLPQFHFVLDLLMKKVIENMDHTYCTFRSKMEPKWRHKSAKCHKIVKQIHAASREPKYVHTNDKISTIRCPLRLDFDAPSHTESLFSLFQIYPISAKLGGHKPPKLSPRGVYGSTKMKGERIRKHQKNATTKVSTNVTNMLPKEGLKK